MGTLTFTVSRCKQMTGFGIDLATGRQSASGLEAAGNRQWEAR
jgi:hypothetical protein